MSDDRGRASPDSQAQAIDCDDRTQPPTTLVTTDEKLLHPLIAPTGECASPPSDVEMLGPSPLNPEKTINATRSSGVRKRESPRCPNCGICLDKAGLHHAGTRTSEMHSNAPKKDIAQAHPRSEKIKRSEKSRAESYKEHLVNPSNDRSWGSSYWSFLDLMLGTTEGQWFSLILIGLVLVVTGTLAWIAVGGNDDVKPTIFESSWLSWGLFFDPGTQTGIAADEPFKIKFVALFFSVLGFIFNLATLGLIVDMVRNRLQYWKEIRNRTVLNNHTIILGWGPRTLFILNELLQAYDAARERGFFGCKRRRRVLIMADEDVMMMQRATRLHLETSEISGHGVYFRRGDPADWIQLRKTSPHSAADIIVMGRGSGSPQESDQFVLQILLALAALPKALEVKGEVVAEMRALENVAVAKNVLSDAAVIEPRYAANRMLCLSGLSPAIGRFMDDLVSFQHGDVLFLTLVPSFLVGQTFEQASRAFGSTCLIGVKQNGKSSVELAPKWEQKLNENDTLVYLSENRLDIAGIKTAASSSLPQMATKIAGDTLGDRSMANKEICALEQKEKIICMIGCPSDFSEFVDLMVSFTDCKIHILSERDVQWRERCMQMAFSTDRSNGYTNNRSCSWDNLIHVVGPTTSQKHLEDLPLEHADCVFILAERPNDVPEDPFAVDSRSLNTIITIRNLLSEDKKPRPEPECVVVCELVDPRSEYVVSNNPKLETLGYYFHSNKVETALIAMCAEERAVFNTLQTLLEFSNETDVITIPVARVLCGVVDRASFWDLQVHLQETFGGVLIGWLLGKQESSRTQGNDFWKPDINPADKNEKKYWKEDDTSLLIVVRRDPFSDRVSENLGVFAERDQAVLLPGMMP